MVYPLSIKCYGFLGFDQLKDFFNTLFKPVMSNLSENVFEVAPHQSKPLNVDFSIIYYDGATCMPLTELLES
jgi:hypothetical protein